MEPPTPDLLGLEPGWTPFDWSGHQVTRSFVSGEPDGDRLRVRYYTTDGGGLAAKAWFGPGAEGPPGHAHGGAMAAVLDEAMGVAGWVAGHAVVAVRLVTDFVQMLPLGTVVRVETEVRAAEGRKVPVEARLVGPEGAVHARSEGLFVTLGGASMDQLREVVDRIR